MDSGIILGIGSPLIDIHAEVKNQFLSKYDLKSNNTIFVTAKHQKLFEELENYPLKFQAGGCITNTLRVLQWITKIPYLTTYLGSVGRDVYANNLKRKLELEKINFVFEEISNLATGKCAVLLNNQNRSLCTDLGASKVYNLEFLKKKNVWIWIEKADYIYLSALFLGVSYDCMLELGEISLKENKCFILNLGAPFLSQKYEKQMKTLIGYVDILFGNENEAREFAKIHGIIEDNLHEIIRKINNLDKYNKKRERIIVITRGIQSILAIQNGEINEYEICKLPEEKIEDTNAAGDAFVGGFLAQFIRKKPLEECINCGIWAATHIVQNVGCNFDYALIYKNQI